MYSINCKDPKHLENIDKVFDFLKLVLFSSTEDYLFDNIKIFKGIPGWNDYVQDLYATARKQFLNWNSKGRPLTGLYRDMMRTARTLFKNALHFCKVNEEEIRREKMVNNFKNKQYKEFWNEVYKVKKNNDVMPSKVDGDNDYNDIAQNFANKYKSILDQKGNEISSAALFDIDLSDIKMSEIDLFSLSDIKKSLKSLKPGIGCDNVHTNHLSFSPDFFLDLLSKLFSACVIHGYLPLDMLKGTINPHVKDAHGDLSSSDNFFKAVRIFST